MVSYSDVGEGGVAVNCEQNTIFPEHPIVGGFKISFVATFCFKSADKDIANDRTVLPQIISQNVILESFLNPPIIPY